MESATASVTIHGVSPQERAWAKMLSILTAREKRVLFEDDTELLLHDQFIKGEVSISDIRAVLATDRRLTS